MGWEKMMQAYLHNAAKLVVEAGTEWDKARAAAIAGSFDPKQALSALVKISGAGLDLWCAPWHAMVLGGALLVVVQGSTGKIGAGGVSGGATLPGVAPDNLDCTDALTVVGATTIPKAQLKVEVAGTANDRLKVTLTDPSNALKAGLYLGHVTSNGVAIARLVIHLV
jgi:hypothetical protein